MHIDIFIQSLKEYLQRCNIVFQDIESVEIVVNPAAGGFKQISKHHRVLRKKLEKIENQDPNVKVKVNTWYTKSPGHAIEIAKEVGNKKGDKDIFVVVLGGDGTSMEFCSGMMSLSKEVRQGTILFRIPLGTGNDGLDAPDFETALDILKKAGNFNRMPSLEITPRGMAKQYAFNIGTVGLDAFVTHMTNKLKKIIPGSFYKAMVDFTTLFYDRFVKIKHMTLSFTDKSGESMALHDRLLFFCMGVTGNRTYGHNIKILPDDNNLLMVSYVKIPRRIKVKGLFYTGEHKFIPETSFYQTSKVKVDYDGRILLNMDGDCLWLTENNFPLQFEILDSDIRLLKS